MSNKTRLQTNNTNLQTLINKANSLPEAGGSGGGGSVEMCTVTIVVNAPNFNDFTVYSSDSNLQIVTTTIPGRTGGTFQAAKGTIAVVTPWEGATLDSNQIYGSGHNGGIGAWIITENCGIGFDA